MSLNTYAAQELRRSAARLRESVAVLLQAASLQDAVASRIDGLDTYIRRDNGGHTIDKTIEARVLKALKEGGVPAIVETIEELGDKNRLTIRTYIEGEFDEDAILSRS